MSVLRLYLIRHGQTADNAAQRFGGSRDSGLTALGWQQTLAVAARLQHFRLHAVYTSPALRTQALARLLCQGRPLAPIVRAELCERSFGRWEGLTYQEAEERDPVLCRAWLEEPLTAAPPEGESLVACMQRLQPLVSSFYSGTAEVWSAERTTPDGKICAAIVAHGGILRALLVSLLHADPSLALNLAIDNGSITVLDIYPPRTCVIKALNDTSHLAVVPGKNGRR